MQLTGKHALLLHPQCLFVPGLDYYDHGNFNDDDTVVMMLMMLMLMMMMMRGPFCERG